ncbi:LOW QUALITY PROTEIN: beta-glucosidase 2 [Colletotrichum tofieldiae]|nr:LOW QUALITY PROTEIN: beta-glucosidase 2 [Colletotrichum tofieldiae]
MITGNSSAGNCIGVIAPVPRLGFKGICMLDGPSAVNRADLVSVFPSGMAAAATWDREMIYRRGFALGEEFKGKGGHVILGNWEGFGPDPYLAGIAIAESVLGTQDAGVQTCSKHYIGNEQETQRSNTTQTDGTRAEAISSNIDDRTLHELYLWPFATAIKAGTSSIMCSYNRVNQTYSCENSFLLKELLRDELGFKGYVVSDWFATHSTADSINAGLDLEMPGLVTNYAGAATYFGENVLNAVKNGSVLEARIDEMEIGLSVGKKGGYIPDDFVFAHGRDVRGNHSKLIREAGAAGTVLLKNVNSTLPLLQPKIIGVFGNDAGDMTDGFYRPSEIPDGVNTGTMIIGGGSGTGRASYIVSPLAAVQAKAREIGAEVLYVTNNDVLARDDFRSVYPRLRSALSSSRPSQSFDRTSFELDGNSTAVVNNVADFCGNTVVVTHSGGVNTMPWANHTKIGAILAAHYPGQESGNSIVDLLWGEVAPSGRLPYTIPLREADAGPPIVNVTQPVSDPLAWQADFTEGQMIDYRHYDALGIEPLYEFGFGLTYTTFAIEEDQVLVSLVAGNASIDARPDASVQVQPGGHPQLWNYIAAVRIKVVNTGDRSGYAVPHLYVSFPESAPAGTPLKVLRGFEKVQIEVGGSAEVEFRLMRRDLSYWDTSAQTWVIPEGDFTCRVGFSSRDLPAEKAFSVLGGR